MQTFEPQSSYLNLWKSDHVFIGTVKLLLYLVMRETSTYDSYKSIHCKKGKQDGLLSCATVVVPAETKL